MKKGKNARDGKEFDIRIPQLDCFDVLVDKGHITALIVWGSENPDVIDLSNKDHLMRIAAKRHLRQCAICSRLILGEEEVTEPPDGVA